MKPKTKRAQPPEPLAEMKEQRPSPKMAPEEYRALLRSINLQEIVLVSCSAALKRDRLAEPLQVDIHKDSVRILKKKGPNLQFEHSYEVTAASQSSREPAIKVKCVFFVEYKAEKTVPKEFFQIFTRVNIPVNTWPYFRELVQNMTVRMGIPPIILPLLHIGR